MLELHVVYSVESMTETAANAVRTNCRDGNPSESVVLAVAEAKDADPLEIEPLNSVVDADALNKLFPTPVDGAQGAGELRFTMADCQVAVYGNGDIVVTPPSTDGNATAATAKNN